MKLKVYRASGMPVNESNIELYQKAYNEFYDRAQKKYMPDLTRVPTETEAEKLNSVLKKFEKRLNRKYPNNDEWEFLKTNKAWKAKLAEVNFPVALALNQDTQQLVYVILDTEF